MSAIRRHVDWWLALAAVVLGVVGYLIDDRTNWTDGYGYDGRFYGELATNWPSAVFSDGTIVPPGLGGYAGPALSGVDSYYAFRIVPSGIVWLGLQALGLSPTHEHVILLFALLAAGMFGLATFCWCRSADLLGLGEKAKLVGAIGLVVNFAVLKTGTYYPVLTDHVALGLGALSLYLWLRRATVALVVCIVLAAFAWPVHLVVGVLLLLFPPPTDAREQLAAAVPARESWRPARFGAIIGCLAALVGMSALIWLQVRGYRSAQGTDQLPLFPLSVAIVGLYVFAVVAFLLPRGGARQLLGIVRSLAPSRVAIAILVAAGVLVGASLLAQRPGFSATDLFKDAFWSTTLDPGIFIVVLVAYYGPLLLVLLGDLPRVAADAWRLGPAMVAILGLGLGLALVDQPREIIDVYPFVLLASVLAVRRLYTLSAPVVVSFLVVSLVLSRFWFPIGDIGVDITKLQDFPAQRYFMATGTWTSPLSYALQLAAVAVGAGALWLTTRAYRRSARHEPRQRAVPAGAPGTSAG
jgi:hypothetical protein